MNIFDRLINYIKSSQIELKKVVWPSRKEVIQHTLLVIGISLGVSAFLGLVDYGLSFILQFVLK